MKKAICRERKMGCPNNPFFLLFLWLPNILNNRLPKEIRHGFAYNVNILTTIV